MACCLQCHGSAEITVDGKIRCVAGCGVFEKKCPKCNLRLFEPNDFEFMGTPGMFNFKHFCCIECGWRL